jgi:diketogulonate reductase-like aldo/keto reductase
MSMQALSRRQFTAQCAAFGLSMPAAWALDAPQMTGAATGAVRTVTFANSVHVPVLGQGSSHLGQGRHPQDVEEDALRSGIARGMTVIDTSGNYGNGRSEQLISQVLAGQRARVFLVSKVEAEQVDSDGIAHACAASLARLGTSYLDLYLLHWPVPSAKFSAVVTAFEHLRAEEKIRAWGVSNFDVGQMETLFGVPGGNHCVSNQVPYSLNNRRIERDLSPWCAKHGVVVMAYSPLGGDRNLVIHDRVLAEIASNRACSPAAVALAWVTRSGNVIAIPEAGSPEHVQENAVALSLQLTTPELQKLDAAYS